MFFYFDMFLSQHCIFLSNKLEFDFHILTMFFSSKKYNKKKGGSDMAVTVYADVLFAWNYLMDLVLLIVTTQFSRAMTRPLRISIAAALLALYGTLVFIPSLKMLYSVLGRIAVGVLAIYLLRLPGGLRGMIKGMVIFLWRPLYAAVRFSPWSWEAALGRCCTLSRSMGAFISRCHWER